MCLERILVGDEQADQVGLDWAILGFALALDELRERLPDFVQYFEILGEQLLVKLISNAALFF